MDALIRFNQGEKDSERESRDKGQKDSDTGQDLLQDVWPVGTSRELACGPDCRLKDICLVRHQANGRLKA